MCFSGRKKPLGNDMTGGHGALPFFIDFMHDFLKGKPKEEFPKPVSMPEDMRELMKQRQREQADERADLALKANKIKQAADNATITPITDPKMTQDTLPPAEPHGAGTTPETPGTTPSTAPRHTEAAPM